jgi:hypothetical protein
MQYTAIMTPHWILAERVRKSCVSPASEAAAGSNRNAYTGMQMAKVPYWLKPINAYCNGTSR